ncbi:hypothetical protein H7X87_02550 [Acetobacteraceae bacterium]|nr:hypothetical protein [Candidatus Parcubacteria bacterium]
MAEVSFEKSVRVKLTKKGRDEFEQFFDGLSEGQQQPRKAFPALPQPDAEGWYSFELWMLLSVFGGLHIRFPEDTTELFEDNVMKVDLDSANLKRIEEIENILGSGRGWGAYAFFHRDSDARFHLTKAVEVWELAMEAIRLAKNNPPQQVVG